MASCVDASIACLNSMLRHFWLVVNGRGSSGAEPSYMAASEIRRLRTSFMGPRRGRLSRSQGLATSGEASLIEIFPPPPINEAELQCVTELASEEPFDTFVPY